MKILRKLNEKELPATDLVSHLEEQAKIIPFPREMNVQGTKVKSNLLKRRVMAFCVDLYAIVMIKIMMTLAYTSFFKAFFFQLPVLKQKRMVEGLMTLDLYIAPIIFFTYFFVSYFSGEGKTVGKLMFKISVVRPDLKNDYFPNMKESFARTIAYMACYMTAGLLFLLPFFRKDQKSLADLWSKTMVMNDHELYEAMKAGAGDDNVITLDIAEIKKEDKSNNQKAA